MAGTMNMTIGKPVRLILRFAIPILLGNLLQQLYNLVDSLIVGRLLGVSALAAVSASGWLDWAVLSIPMGLAQGFSIQAAQDFGAADYPRLRRTVGQSIRIALVSTLALEIISQSMLQPVLVMMRSPAETIHMTRSYLRIIYAGIPVVMTLNTLNGFLHALGNSKTPLMGLGIASCINIALDILFVGYLGMGTDGGAYATVTAQIVSSLISFRVVLHTSMLHPGKEDMARDREMTRRILKLGLPIGFQNAIISVGGLVLQGVVNGFGFVFMAGYNATSRLQGLIELSGSSLGNAAGTFAGQNYGAGRIDRVKQGLRASARIGFFLAILLGVLLIATGRPLLSFFIQDEPELEEQVLTFAYQFLSVMALGLPLLYLLFIYRSTLQGLGNTVTPMVSGFVELLMRVGTALLLPRIFGVWGLYSAEIAAWAGAAVLLMIGYYREIRKISVRTTRPVL